MNEDIQEIVSEFQKITPYNINGVDTSSYAEQLEAFLREKLISYGEKKYREGKLAGIDRSIEIMKEVLQPTTEGHE